MEEPTRFAITGPLPSVDSLGQAGPAFQDVDENPADAEHRNPGGLESQFVRYNTALISTPQPPASFHPRFLVASESEDARSLSAGSESASDEL